MYGENVGTRLRIISSWFYFNISPKIHKNKIKFKLWKYFHFFFPVTAWNNHFWCKKKKRITLENTILRGFVQLKGKEENPNFCSFWMLEGGKKYIPGVSRNSSWCQFCPLAELKNPIISPKSPQEHLGAKRDLLPFLAPGENWFFNPWLRSTGHLWGQAWAGGREVQSCSPGFGIMELCWRLFKALMSSLISLIT